MCRTLAELKQASQNFMSGFDAALVPPAQLAQILEDAGAIEKMMATLTSIVAARMSTIGRPSTAFRQAARQLAHASGTSLGQAMKALETAKALPAQPELDAAARAGELSRQQASLVAEAVSVNPGSAQKLLDAAKVSSLVELAAHSARARAAVQDLEQRRQAIHASRSLRQYVDPSGTWYLRAQGTPEQGALIMAGVTAQADKAFQIARRDGRRESPEAYAFDGLVSLATSGGGASPRPEVIVRVDHAALLRGYPESDEVCDVPGFGPTSVQAVFDMMESGDPLIKAVVTKGKDVVNVAHLGHRPKAHQKTALDWLFPCCAAEGCGTRADFLQTDHRVDYAECRFTLLDLLDRLCPFHHSLKTYQGWGLVQGRGKRPFVPPDDARHPRHTGPPSLPAKDP